MKSIDNCPGGIGKRVRLDDVHSPCSQNARKSCEQEWTILRDQGQIVPVTASFQLHDDGIVAQVIGHLHVAHHFFGGMHEEISLGKPLKECLESAASDRRKGTEPRQFFVVEIGMYSLIRAAIQVIVRRHVKLPHVLRLPGSERLRIHSLNIGVREQGEHFQALRGSHLFCENRNRSGIKDVSPQGCRQLQVIGDEKRNFSAFFRVDVEPIHGLIGNV